MAKNDNTKYWWIKLETNFFYQNAIDFLMSQKNGSNYVVLYQMLCLNSANTQGRLEQKIGDMIVKYDVAKIQRDTKYFDLDTIRVALELYKGLGLVYEEKDGTLLIINHDEMVGYKTGGAIRKELARKSKRDNLGTNVPKSIELRDKNKDIKDRDLITPPKSPKGYVSDNKLKENISIQSQFDLFWKEYPKHINKQASYEQFRSMKLDNGMLTTLIENLNKQKKSIEWSREQGRFIPSPQKYLKGKLWEDELTYQITVGQLGVDEEIERQMDNIFKKLPFGKGA